MINEKFSIKTGQNEAKILPCVSITFSNVKAEIPYDGFQAEFRVMRRNENGGENGGIRRRKIVTGMEQHGTSWPLRLSLRM